MSRVASSSGASSRPAGRVWRSTLDWLFSKSVITAAAVLLILIGWIGLQLVVASRPTLARFGLSMLTDKVWDVPRGRYGAATFIFGTLVSSAVALLIAIPLGVGAALFLTEAAPKWLAKPIAIVVELLAAVPSIVYGLWGFTVMCPFLQQHVNPLLEKQLGANPLFSGTPVLTNVLAAGMVLAIMVLPFITAISREVILTVPVALRDASVALGGTRWETIKNVVLPASKAGISGACILGLGRAIGETMAVVMVIGNTPQIKASLLQPGYTMSGLLANQFSEAFNDVMQRSALLEVALILFVITLLVNVFAHLFVNAAKASLEGRGNAHGRVAKLADFIGRYGAGMLVVGLVLLQFGADVRQYGAAGLGRAFEIGIYVAVAGTLMFRAARAASTSLRKIADGATRVGFWLCGGAACFFLGAVLYYVSSKGLGGLSPQLFTQLPHPPGMPGGGLKNAMIGTLELIGVAIAVGVPFGLLSGIYLAEFGAGRFGTAVRFGANVLNGVPSVIVGLFAYAAFVLPFGHFSGWAGGLALAIVIVPTVARTTEDMLRLVPDSHREAALSHGATKPQVVLTVTLPAAKAGIVTGVMLGIARAAGETAPLLFTAFGSEVLNANLGQPMSSLTMKIYQYAVSPYDDWISQAWAGAFVLLAFVLLLNVTARIVVSRSRLKVA